MSEWHPLLRRQLDKQLSSALPPPAELQPLLEAVSAAYIAADLDRQLLERSLDLASQELLQRNRELRDLLDAQPDCVLRLSAAGHLLEVYGDTVRLVIPEGVVLGQPLAEVVLPAVAHQLATGMERALASQGRLLEQHWFETSQGRRFWECRYMPIFVGQCLVLIRDDTEQKEIEERLRESREISEAANLAKSSFLATMSHELRTPLNAILGFVRVLQKLSWEPLGQARFQLYLERIRSNGLHLLNLINQVLDISRIEAGQESVRCESTVLQDLLYQVISESEPIFSSKKLLWQLDLPPVSLTLAVDRMKLRQVLINLLSNAAKFTPEGGRICIRLLHPGEGPPCVEVQDSGIGISPELQERIFEPFFQADPSHARLYGGLGLGLSISLSLCQLMGYALRVSSQLGKGTCFSLYLGTQDPIVDLDKRELS